MRNPFASRPKPRTTASAMTSVDLTAAAEAFRGAAASMARMSDAARNMRVDLRPFDRLSDGIYIRTVARRERAIARAYLDDLVDDAYARYGLTRGDADA